MKHFIITLFTLFIGNVYSQLTTEHFNNSGVVSLLNVEYSTIDENSAMNIEATHIMKITEYYNNEVLTRKTYTIEKTNFTNQQVLTWECKNDKEGLIVYVNPFTGTVVLYYPKNQSGDKVYGSGLSFNLSHLNYNGQPVVTNRFSGM